jgi:hypothetical protein
MRQMPRPAKSRPAKTHPAVWRVCTKAHTEKENKKPHSAAGKSKYQTHRLKYARTPATSSGNKQHRIWELILACPDNTPPQTSYNPVTGIFIQVKHPIQAPTVKLPKSATIQSCIEVTWKL